MSEIKPGDFVRLIGAPDWLIHDLPDDEVNLIMAQVGRVAVVTEIDDYGFFWLWFECAEAGGGMSSVSGWFCVSGEYLQRL